MNASDTTPSNGECVSEESLDYQTVGQELLQAELDRLGHSVRREFVRASAKAESGDLDLSELQSLENQVLHCQHVLAMLRSAMEDE